MTTTSLRFVEDCPKNAGAIADELAGPEMRLAIVSTAPCADSHRSHLDYTDTSGSRHDMVHEVELDVPDDKLTVSIKWRTGVVEQISSIPIGYRVQQDLSSEERTELVFEVPRAGDAPRSWVVSGGSPGFKLTVTVKRK